MILDKENVAELWQVEKARADLLAAELERVRIALDGYDDSDLASLARTVMRQNEALQADNEQWRNAIETPRPIPPALEVARSVEAALALLQASDAEELAHAAFFAGHTAGYREGYGNRRLVDASRKEQS